MCSASADSAKMRSFFPVSCAVYMFRTMTHRSVILLPCLSVFKCLANAQHTESGAALQPHKKLCYKRAATIYVLQKAQVHGKALTSCCMLSEAGRAPAGNCGVTGLANILGYSCYLTQYLESGNSATGSDVFTVAGRSQDVHR
jgi:hypothetical protein